MQRRPLLTALTLAFVALTAQAQAPDWKKIRIGVEGAYPPFSEVGTDGKLKGFDIDMAMALCAEMKAECSLVQQEWDGMIPALQARKFDAIIASMAITPERQKQVNFSDKYYNTPPAFFGKGSARDISPAALKGKKIGVQRATSHDRYAAAYYKDSEIVRYAKQDEVFLDLAAGRIDAALCDQVAGVEGFLKKPMGKGFGVLGQPKDDPAIFGTGSGIAVRKADTALQQKLNAAIAAVRANGSYKKIQDKYFDFDIYGK
ncbi:MAG: ABC transporter substrate-binding protein [Ideonella sp. MAG2]|nr:MAG: ABC transporter substrate-binding protein [Ideonella sp. MAG2]